MKTQIKEEINKLYSLFKKPPTLDVKNTKQHIQTFAYNKKQLTPLRKAVNIIIGSGRCAWCNTNKAKVQNGFRDDLSRKEYQISALCQRCQDSIFDIPDELIIENLPVPIVKDPPSYKKDNLKPGEFNPKDIGSDGYEYIEDMDEDYE